MPKFRNFDNFALSWLETNALRNFVISCWSFIGIISYCDTQHEISKFRNYEITRLRDYEITRLRDYEISKFRNYENFEIARARLRNFVISCWSFIGIISYCDTQHEITKFRNYEISRLRVEDYDFDYTTRFTKFRNYENFEIARARLRNFVISC